MLDTPSPSSHLDSILAVPEIVLVACCKTKLDHRTAAQDIYQGALFKLARQYAEGIGAPWYILSAKHHILRPGELIDPYEETLIGRKKKDRQIWSDRTGCKARQLFRQDGWPQRILWLAGETYSEFLEENFGTSWRFGRTEIVDGKIINLWQALPCEHAFPLAHLGIGLQKKRLAEMISEIKRIDTSIFRETMAWT